jgi:Flp pilus assembly pilin Flp
MWTALALLRARLRADRHAASAIEYALIGSLVAGAAMAGMIALGISLDQLFTNVSGQIVAQTPVDPARCVEVGSNCPK